MIMLLHVLSRVPSPPHGATYTTGAHPGSASDGPAASMQSTEGHNSAPEDHHGLRGVPQHTHEAPESPEHASGSHEEEAAFFWHLCASGFLCPEFHAQAAALLADLSAADTWPPPPALPFLHMHAGQWPRVRRVMRAWADAPMPAAEARAHCQEHRRRSMLCVPPPHVLAVRRPGPD